MPTQPSLDKIAQAVIEGIEKAYKDYLEWAGEWLSWAPEYLITVKIAEKLAKSDVGYVTLENNVKTVATESGSKKTLSKRARPKGRCDIVVYYADERPRVIIEVKSSHSNKGYYNDAIRVKEMLKENSSLQAGILAGYISRDVNDLEASTFNVENRPDRILAKLNEKIGKNLITPALGKVRSDGGYSWRAICFLIKK